MKNVYVVESGCIYEGGRIDGVFLRHDLAIQKFEELIAEERRQARKSAEYSKEYGFLESPEEYWTHEQVTEREDFKEVIFHGMDYVRMNTFQCEE